MAPPEQEKIEDISGGKISESPESPEFQLTVSKDEMQLLFSCVVGDERPDQISTAVYRELQERDIPEGNMFNDAIRAVDQALKPGARISNLVILEGIMPIDPIDGRIEWADNYFDTGFVVDEETGTFDYRKRSAKTTVTDGELLATCIPPVPGKGGVDVFGKIVPARKPIPAQLRAGNHVRLDEEKGTYYSEIDGRIRIAGQFLHVDDILEIQGSVDLSTGNLRHPGAVIVHENIEADSEIIATGDIEVNGYIENAVIRTSGVLTVHGGITGGIHKGIYAVGGVRALFLQNTAIDSEGDIIVERGIDQCAIRTRGAVVVTNGRIIGGHVTALAGVMTDQVGSDASVTTTITVGEDYTLKRKLAEKEKEIEERNETLKKITEKLRPFRENGLKNLSPKLKDAVSMLLHEAQKIKMSISEIESEIAIIRAESKARAKGVVIIRKEIFPDAVFNVPPLTNTIREQVRGPIKIAIRDGEVNMMQTRLNNRDIRD